jgi:hypothetical protein
MQWRPSIADIVRAPVHVHDMDRLRILRGKSTNSSQQTMFLSACFAHFSRRDWWSTSGAQRELNVSTKNATPKQIKEMITSKIAEATFPLDEFPEQTVSFPHASLLQSTRLVGFAPLSRRDWWGRSGAQWELTVATKNATTKQIEEIIAADRELSRRAQSLTKRWLQSCRRRW